MGCNNCNTIKNIVEGYKNTIFKNKEIEELAKSRLQHCINCKHNKVVGIKNTKLLSYCDLCKCVITAAIRAKDKKCKLNKW